MKEAHPLQTLFDAFRHLKVLVVGDVMLDNYIHGEVDRISPEAPVPVILVNKRESRPGGAANVAMNIRAMGAAPLLVSVIGDDRDGESLMNLLEEEKIDATGLLKDPDRHTTNKTRIIAKGHQMLRLDLEKQADISEELESLVIERAKSLLDEDKPDVLIFQDYNKGLLTERVIRSITMLCLERNIPIAVDPKKKNFFAYQMCTLFKPNLREIRESLLIDVQPGDPESLAMAASALHDRLHNGITMITLADKGVFVRTSRESMTREAHVRNVADVSGAGDTVISVASLCLGAKSDWKLMAALSNLAGGIVCEYPGVVQIDPKRLLKEAKELDLS